MDFNDLQKQLDVARIAVINNMAAYDDDLQETYDIAKDEVAKVVDLFNILFANGIDK